MCRRKFILASLLIIIKFSQISIFDFQIISLAFSLNSKDYLNQNVDPIENTPEEIKELVLEMEARLNGNWKSTPEDDQLQRHFWENYPAYAVSENNNRRLHGKLNLHYGSDFLRNNSIWFN
jgi:hypothetical protein